MITIKTTPKEIQNAFLRWRLETMSESDTKEFLALSPNEKSILDAKTFMRYLCEGV